MKIMKKITHGGNFSTELSTIPVEISQLIESHHNDIFGHGGIDRTKNAINKTLDTLKQQGREFTSPYLRRIPEYCRQYIGCCVKCQFMTHVKPVVFAKRYTVHTYKPMQNIAIDAIGPCEIDTNGHKYILVFIDTFSRWIQLYPITDVSAISAAKHLINFIGIFGSPQIIQHDQGTEFDNELWNELTRIMGIHKRINHAYSKEENAIVERSNKEVVRHLRNFIFLNDSLKNNWSIILPLIQRSYNNSPNCRIGNIKPSQIIFGNAIDFDDEILFHSFDIPTFWNNIEYKDYLIKLIKSQAAIIARAQDIQLIHHTNHTRDHLNNHTNYEVETYVLIDRYAPHTDWTKKSKMESRWVGPYKIISKDDDWYTIMNLTTNNSELIHVTQMKPFKYDPAKTNPIKVAQQTSG